MHIEPSLHRVIFDHLWPVNGATFGGKKKYLALNVCCFNFMFSLKLFSIQEEFSEIS